MGGKGGSDKRFTVEAEEEEMGADAAGVGMGKVDWAWLRSAQRRCTFAELIWGAGGGGGRGALDSAGQVCACMWTLPPAHGCTHLHMGTCVRNLCIAYCVT